MENLGLPNAPSVSDQSTVAFRLPWNVLKPRRVIGGATHGEEQVAEAVYPTNCFGRHCLGMIQMHHQSLRAPTDGPSDVQTGGEFTPTRKDEAPNFRRRGVIMIDQAFEHDDVGIVDAADLLAVSCSLGRRKVSPEIEGT